MASDEEEGAHGRPGCRGRREPSAVERGLGRDRPQPPSHSTCDQYLCHAVAARRWRRRDAEARARAPARRVLPDLSRAAPADPRPGADRAVRLRLHRTVRWGDHEGRIVAVRAAVRRGGGRTVAHVPQSRPQRGRDADSQRAGARLLRAGPGRRGGPGNAHRPAGTAGGSPGAPDPAPAAAARAPPDRVRPGGHQPPAAGPGHAQPHPLPDRSALPPGVPAGRAADRPEPGGRDPRRRHPLRQPPVRPPGVRREQHLPDHRAGGRSGGAVPPDLVRGVRPRARVPAVRPGGEGRRAAARGPRGAGRPPGQPRARPELQRGDVRRPGPAHPLAAHRELPPRPVQGDGAAHPGPDGEPDVHPAERQHPVRDHGHRDPRAAPGRDRRQCGERRRRADHVPHRALRDQRQGGRQPLLDVRRAPLPAGLPGGRRARRPARPVHPLPLPRVLAPRQEAAGARREPGTGGHVAGGRVAGASSGEERAAS